MTVVTPTPAGLAIAASALRRGEIVAYPTETVYGLAVDPFSREAVRRLFEAKGRDAGNPILVVVADEAQLERIVAGVSARARAFAEAFWPGPLSMLFPGSPEIPKALCGEGGRVCVRCTASIPARGLCMAFGGGVTSTSANRAGEPAAVGLEGLEMEAVSVGIDGGILEGGPPSTVLDPESGELLREGRVSRTEIEAVDARLRETLGRAT